MEVDFLVGGVSARMDFFFRVKIFHCSSHCFFPTMKLPKVARLAFGRAQVLALVLRNNCKYVIWLSFSIPGQF